MSAYAKMLGRTVKSSDGVITMEALIVLPTQLLIICLIVQLGHFIIATQFTYYAAFAAARTVLVEDTQRMSAGMSMGPGERAWQAAAHACSPMEIFTVTNSWVDLPTGGSFKNNAIEKNGADLVRVELAAYDGKADGDFEVRVTYSVPLPVPFANRVFYTFFQSGGRASARDLRVNITQSVTMVRPWE